MTKAVERSRTGRVVFPFLCLFIAYVLGSGVVNQVWPSERTVEVACQAIGDTFDVKSSVSCDWYAVGVLELGRTDTQYRGNGTWHPFNESAEGLLGQDEPIICQAVLWRFRTGTLEWLLDRQEHPNHLEDCRLAPSDSPM